MIDMDKMEILKIQVANMVPQIIDPRVSTFERLYQLCAKSVVLCTLKTCSTCRHAKSHDHTVSPFFLPS